MEALLVHSPSATAIDYDTAERADRAVLSLASAEKRGTAMKGMRGIEDWVHHPSIPGIQSIPPIAVSCFFRSLVISCPSEGSAKSLNHRGRRGSQRTARSRLFSVTLCDLCGEMLLKSTRQQLEPQRSQRVTEDCLCKALLCDRACPDPERSKGEDVLSGKKLLPSNIEKPTALSAVSAVSWSIAVEVDPGRSPHRETLYDRPQRRPYRLRHDPRTLLRRVNAVALIRRRLPRHALQQKRNER